MLESQNDKMVVVNTVVYHTNILTLNDSHVVLFKLWTDKSVYNYARM